jgi:hypothetical protein
LHSGDAAAGARAAKHRTFAFTYGDHNASLNHCTSWANAIQRLSQGDSLQWEGALVTAAQERKYLCVVNPVSGKGIAMSMFHCTVLPMMVQANITYELLSECRMIVLLVLCITCPTACFPFVLLSSDGILWPRG